MTKSTFLRSRRTYWVAGVVVILALGLIVWPAVRAENVAIVTTPSGLNSGEQYRLVLVTSTVRTADTRVIDTYNDFVAAAAGSSPRLAALETTWTVIGSTQEGPHGSHNAIHAATNTSTNFRARNVEGNGVPIYRLDGVRVADHYLDLWDSSIQNPISVTEAGSIYSGFVWTGTTGTGTRTTRVLGNGQDGHAGEAKTSYGDSTRTDLGWINVRSKSAALLSLDNTGHKLPFYAISGVLTAPSHGAQ